MGRLGKTRTGRVTNEEVLERAGEKKTPLLTIRKKKKLDRLRKEYLLINALERMVVGKKY